MEKPANFQRLQTEVSFNFNSDDFLISNFIHNDRRQVFNLHWEDQLERTSKGYNFVCNY